MAQEEKQLLIKNLHARLPYGVICELSNNIVNIIERLEFGGLEQFITGNINVRPYLRPISSMTEEEEEWRFYKGRVAESCDEMLEERIAELHDWFNAHHFDYHGLIKKGLALEAPEGMYKTE